MVRITPKSGLGRTDSCKVRSDPGLQRLQPAVLARVEPLEIVPAPQPGRLVTHVPTSGMADLLDGRFQVRIAPNVREQLPVADRRESGVVFPVADCHQLPDLIDPTGLDLLVDS